MDRRSGEEFRSSAGVGAVIESMNSLYRAGVIRLVLQEEERSGKKSFRLGKSLVPVDTTRSVPFIIRAFHQGRT